MVCLPFQVFPYTTSTTLRLQWVTAVLPLFVVLFYALPFFSVCGEWRCLSEGASFLFYPVRTRTHTAAVAISQSQRHAVRPIRSGPAKGSYRVGTIQQSTQIQRMYHICVYTWEYIGSRSSCFLLTFARRSSTHFRQQTKQRRSPHGYLQGTLH